MFCKENSNQHSSYLKGKTGGLKGKAPTPATTWVDPEDMTKNEISQTQKGDTAGPTSEVLGGVRFTGRGRVGVTGWGRGEGVTI